MGILRTTMKKNASQTETLTAAGSLASPPGGPHVGS
jgi:hypothetical protein